jgi:hypothetical protein
MHDADFDERGPVGDNGAGDPHADRAAATSARRRRVVHHADALAWLTARERMPGVSVITSLPDRSELPELSFDAWRSWFENAAELVARSVADEGVAIFFQSDIRLAGTWLDKGALVARGAERAGMRLVFHKIVCSLPPGTASHGRPSYSHLLGYTRSALALPPGTPCVDVIPDAGYRPGSKAMGVNACLDACNFVKAATSTRTVLDPFCGWGTILAVANALGLDAIGADRSRRMCARARRLVLDMEVNLARAERVN